MSRGLGLALLCSAVAAMAFPASGYARGATMIRTNPAGKSTSKLPETSPSIALPNALVSSHAIAPLFLDGSPASRPITVIPQGWPPHCWEIVRYEGAPSISGLRSMGRMMSPAGVHPSSFNSARIQVPAHRQSGHSLTYRISKGVGGIAAASSASICLSGIRGFFSLKSASSASLAFLLASSDRALAFIISARAVSSAALAFRLSDSSTEVRQSDCSSRIVVDRHCNSRNAIVAQAPIAVMRPPPKTPFHAIGYQYSAHSNNEGSTATRLASFWFVSAMAIVILAPIALLVFFAVSLWRWRR